MKETKVSNTVWHWRWKAHLQALNEAKEEASYFPYIEELRAFDKLPRELTADQYWEEPKPKTKYTAMKQFLVDLVEKNKAERLGAGAFRTVYGFYDNPEVILKVARGAHGRSSFKMNKDDYELFRKYPSLSPRVYAHDDKDWAWVYMEDVEPARPSEDGRYYDSVRNTFPAVTKYIMDNVNDYLPINPYDPDDLMLVLSTAAAKLSRGDRRLYVSGPRDISIEDWADRHKENLLKVAGPAFIQLSKAMVEYDISPHELRQVNVGYGKDDQLIIIDSSIFED